MSYKQSDVTIGCTGSLKWTPFNSSSRLKFLFFVFQEVVTWRPGVWFLHVALTAVPQSRSESSVRTGLSRDWQQLQKIREDTDSLNVAKRSHKVTEMSGPVCISQTCLSAPWKLGSCSNPSAHKYTTRRVLKTWNAFYMSFHRLK